MNNTIFAAIVSITLSVAAQFSLKAGMSNVGVKKILSAPYTLQAIFSVFTNKYVLCGFLLYGLGAIVWLGVLSKWDVSKAYPLVGLGFVFTVGIGSIVGEHITIPRMIGVVLICAGVFMVGRS